MCTIQTIHTDHLQTNTNMKEQYVLLDANIHYAYHFNTYKVTNCNKQNAYM